MTRKKSPSEPEDPTPQKGEDSKKPAARRPGAGKAGGAGPRRRKSPAGARAAKPGAAEADAEAAEATARVSLPAFGFAEDLLQKPETQADDEPPGSEAEAAASETDPRRIFRFADSLEQATREESAAVPVRLETWVAFSLAGEVYALPVEPVREVVRVASITRVPHAPRPIRGVTNMRGRVIPVIDLRLRIELPQTELRRASRVIVVSSRGRLLGLLVDAVHQVIHLDPTRVQPPPDDVMTIQSDYLSGVYHLEDQLVLLLDIDRALIIHDAPPAGARAADPAAGDPAAGTQDAGAA